MVFIIAEKIRTNLFSLQAHWESPWWYPRFGGKSGRTPTLTPKSGTLSREIPMSPRFKHSAPPKRMPLKWAEWLCKDTGLSNPIISPINADLRGLPQFTSKQAALKFCIT